jgi:putative ATPase
MTLRQLTLEQVNKHHGPGPHADGTPQSVHGHRFGHELYRADLGNGKTLHISQGDLTKIGADAIVNAANEWLQHGGGLAGALSRKGGPTIQAESDAWIKAHGRITHTSAAVTGAGTLPAKHIIHAVAPIWRGGTSGEPEQLEQAYTSALDKAAELGHTSIAIPSLGTGIFGVPKQVGAEAAMNAAMQFAAKRPNSTVKDIHIVNFDSPTVKVMHDTARAYFGDQPSMFHGTTEDKLKSVLQNGIRPEMQSNFDESDNNPVRARSVFFSASKASAEQYAREALDRQNYAAGGLPTNKLAYAIFEVRPPKYMAHDEKGGPDDYRSEQPIDPDDILAFTVYRLKDFANGVWEEKRTELQKDERYYVPVFLHDDDSEPAVSKELSLREQMQVRLLKDKYYAA